MRDRLARRDHAELRDPIHRRHLPLVEILQRVVILDFGDHLLRELVGRIVTAGAMPLTPRERLAQ